MCGICGIVEDDPGQRPDRTVLARMNAMLVHRGPDGEGLHVAPGIGLAIRRLSVIDVEHGHQPLANEDESVRVVCNGEIYNHLELRATLERRGHVFRTHSDVEVIVHLYEEHGADFVTHLRGMFAIALWDARARTLLLVRDRLGIKPLHYARTRTALLFASEQKAILASGMVGAEPDASAIAQVFSYARVIGARTMVKDIRRLPAGHMLSFTSGGISVRRYWDARFPARNEYDRRTSAAAWADALRDKLTEAVRLHLRSDVPVGAWLSAGLDSSSITALMARLLGGRIPTFTLRFEDGRFDELLHQKALDDFPAFGLDGHRVFCRAGDLARLPKAIWHGEDTLMAGIIVGQLVVAEATAPHVKVVLTGEGSDEIFGGYSWYTTWRVLQPMFALPARVRRHVAALPFVRRRWPGAAGVLAGERPMSFERYARSVTHLRGAAAGPMLFADDFLARAHDDPLPGEVALPAGFEEWHPFAQLQYLDIRHRLAEAVEQGLDRTSMAYSVEARVPFLDHELVEFCARIPPRVKMQWLTEKQVLRRAMEGILPAAILHRRKHAMQVPTEAWMRGRLPDLAEALLSDAALRAKGYFDPRKVADARRRHARGERLGQVLISVLGLQLWDEIFRCGRSVEALR